MHELSRAQFWLSEIRRLNPNATQVLFGHGKETVIDIKEFIDCIAMLQEENQDQKLEVTFQSIDQEITCKSCGRTFSEDTLQMSCPDCGSTQLNMYPIDKLEIIEMQ